MKIVFKASNIIEAHIVAGMLNACEIQTYVGGYFLQGAVGDISPTGFANVFVSPQDFDQAAALVADYEKTENSPADFAAHKWFALSF
ncbi:putative signal transducing protein [Limnobacter sp.]|uniref:putative signal transducing protein n=1 Tax=Limnobacter sp. TaxID=2003368 RepID=UPI002FE18A2E